MNKKQQAQIKQLHEDIYNARVDLRQISERVDEYNPCYIGSVNRKDRESPTKIGAKLMYLGHLLIEMGESTIKENRERKNS